jgi:SNF2 family DNA or RNA helicase
MGLGKTFVGSEKLISFNRPYNLVICQKSKLKDWLEHFQTYYPKIHSYIYKDKINEGITIINYDTVWRRADLSKMTDFALMLDESQYIKNSKAKRTKFILKLKPSNVILLSGTPIGGRYEELWTQCQLLGYDITKTAFYSCYIITKRLDVGGTPVDIVVGYRNIDRLKAKLREHGAIFQKTEDVFNLPAQTDINVNIEITKEYKQFKKDRIITIEDKQLVGDTSLTKLLYLRQLAGIYNKHKLDSLSDLIESTSDRIIIFYNFKEEFERIKAIIKKPLSYVNGQGMDLKNYNDANDSITLVQYQSGATGLNLQLANKVVYYSLPLSSDLFQQSMKRIHRLGQDRPCFYWYLLCGIEHDIKKVLDERKDFTDELFKEVDK